MKPPYVETDASGIKPGAALLQISEWTTCSRATAPDTTILRPITFASKGLTSTE